MFARFDVPKYPSPVDEKYRKLEELEAIVAKATEKRD
jgi:hypothetical protein